MMLTFPVMQGVVCLSLKVISSSINERSFAGWWDTEMSQLVKREGIEWWDPPQQNDGSAER